MCGIWTLINLNRKNINISKYFANFWSMKHRGPDNSSFETYEQVLVGFHRLAIMDISFRSNQPFICQDNLNTIVFICNGEIYNFRELIKEYNLPIHNNSDCMTIPQLYIKFRNNKNKFKDLFNLKIKGEFAFILLEFDVLKNLKYVCVGRDMIGIRPLYYNSEITNNLMIFSSEIKGTLNFPDKIKEYEPGIITEFKIDEFNDINKSIYNFQWIYNIKSILHTTEEVLLQNLKIAVINSIRRRLSADRPIAFLLSGGVDSSLVSAISARILNEPIKTFCCGMKEGTDLLYAKKVAEHIKSNHTEVLFTPEEGLQAIENVIWATETWDTTTIRASVGQFLVSKYIGTKTDCKVVLVGEGPDEVCSSYLFNWYAPDGNKLHMTALNYVKELHLYDCRRGDRCVSYWGLEARVPFLDPEVINAYWEIKSELRHPKYKNIEKWWLRKAFDGMDLLPQEVLWRKKEAFSDGVSSKTKSWYEIIQSFCNKYIDDKNMKDCPSKEALYYKTLFIKFFTKKNIDIIPHYWQPKWLENGVEIDSNNYIDPSARVLNIYKKSKKSKVNNLDEIL